MMLLSKRSMITGKRAVLVFAANQPSLAKPRPAPNTTRKSSDPKVLPIPMERMARSRYKTMNEAMILTEAESAICDLANEET